MPDRACRFAILGVALISGGAWAEECKLVEPLEIGTVAKYSYVVAPGRYCLEEDIIQGKIFDIHAGGYKSQGGESLIYIHSLNGMYRAVITGKMEKSPRFIASDEFFVDMKGHVLEAKAENMLGVSGYESANVSIRNGVIIVPGGRYPNVGIDVVYGVAQPRFSFQLDSYPYPLSAGSQKREDISWRDSIEKKSLVYHYDRSRVEDMTIRAGWRGVQMGGGGNVIRNSTIEVDGHTAIYVYGPETVIENNTIIVHGKGNAMPFDAAIKLRDAKGAIVRNNRILYKGLWPFSKAPAAINLLDSTDVTIEGNTVERFEKLVRSNGETRFSDKNNVFK